MANRQQACQAIIWSNDGLEYWRIYVSLSFKEITHCGLWHHMVLLNLVNIGSGKGLLPNGTKPLPVPMLINQWDLVAFTWEYHHRKYDIYPWYEIENNPFVSFQLRALSSRTGDNVLRSVLLTLRQQFQWKTHLYASKISQSGENFYQ